MPLDSLGNYYADPYWPVPDVLGEGLGADEKKDEKKENKFAECKVTRGLTLGGSGTVTSGSTTATVGALTTKNWQIYPMWMKTNVGSVSSWMTWRLRLNSATPDTGVQLSSDNFTTVVEGTLRPDGSAEFKFPEALTGTFNESKQQLVFTNGATFIPLVQDANCVLTATEGKSTIAPYAFNTLGYILLGIAILFFIIMLIIGIRSASYTCPQCPSSKRHGGKSVSSED